MKSSWENASNLSSLWGQLVAEELVRHQVGLVCIAPGSRSTPLVAAIAKREKLSKVVCQDERSAGFVALGHARATQRPAVVVVTSGSAVANLFPAVVEAANDKIPLIVLTADRPPELRDAGANQTMDQTKIFGNHVRWFADLPVPDEKISPRFLLSCVDYAIGLSMSPKKGPVHLNFMFREPFALDFYEHINPRIFDALKNWEHDKKPLTQYVSDSKMPSVATLLELSGRIDPAKTGAFVLCEQLSKACEESVISLAERLGWPIFPDVRSGLRFKAGTSICNFVDLSLLDDCLKEQKIDLVIQIGGRIVSKRLQLFLANRVENYIIVSDSFERMDPSCMCSMHIDTNVSELFVQLNKYISRKKEVTMRSAWFDASTTIENRLKQYDEEQRFNEITVARTLVDNIGKDQFLFVGSSMPIRDVSMFASGRNEALALFSNRGVSGIDGILSSACGVSLALNASGVLFCGDLTFLHDVGGLSFFKSLKQPMQIVVVNNRGGGIFAMLDVYRQKEIFSPYFDAEHDIDISKFAKAHGIDFQQVCSLEQWMSVLRELRYPLRHRVIEVISDKHENRIEHDALLESIRHALELSRR